MTMKTFDALPETSRLWIFPSSTPLSENQRREVEQSLENALAAWNAHGSPVEWGYTVVHDHFLLIAVNENAAALTGCSIDHAVRALQNLEHEHGLSLTDSHRVFYRHDGAIHGVSRDVFQRKVEAGEITLDTTVFDTVAATLSAYVSGAWEGPAKNSWHARAFPFELAT